MLSGDMGGRELNALPSRLGVQNPEADVRSKSLTTAGVQDEAGSGGALP